ncbi:bacteriocin fulvocin C-related protein [Sciscionella sediminilitoris]|uniref:bacteriocin fulvocin C-related protein n=1 Tax=Sciscionella sediminilitoris TaxID=1445613 RepID=UPI0004DF5FA1|nr:bacteriocin fulvocin C-related protein [Sciscionella sp. SE31]
MEQPPRSYDEFTAGSLEQRRQWYGSLAEHEQDALWMEQFRRYREAHAHELSTQQEQIIESAMHLFHGIKDPVAIRELGEQARDAFGFDEARRLFATLGPEE